MNIFDYLPNLDQIKLISFLLSLIFGSFLVFIIARLIKLQKRSIESVKNVVAPPKAAQGGIAAKWEEILTHINSPREFEWKFSVIEADKLMDQVLKSAGYLGETLGERLVNIDKTRLVTLDGLWEAHKLRNRIVHDANIFLRYAEAKRAIDLFQKSLEELGVL